MGKKIIRVEIQHKFIGEEFYALYEAGNGFYPPSEVQNFKEDDIIKFYIDNDESYEFSCGTVKKFLNGDLIGDKEKNKLESLGTMPIKFEEGNLIEMHFEDVTEAEIFDFYPIKENFLNNKDHGLWAYSGLRKFRIYFENAPSCIQEAGEDIKCTASLVFDKKDTKSIDEPIKIDKIVCKKDTKLLNQEFFTYIDTNRLGDEFDQNNQRMQFSGNFQVVYEWEGKDDYKEIFIFPITIIMHNTNYSNDKELCAPLEKGVVSIDFGTSSTCVAVRKGKDIELLTLSSERLNEEKDEDEVVNQFENPTNIMIYRWEEIYKQWSHENKNSPMFLKGTKQEEIEKIKKVEYDFGYTVKDVLEDVQNAELNAILTQIKLIPYKLMQGEQLEINPYIKQETNVIKLVSSPEEEDKEHFDPIAFYAYLLGRAINDPSQGKVYTKFDITYPVKFNSEVREKMKKSLEYGLKRSIPLPLREAKDKKDRPIVSVNMKYSEPVAYIGAMCGKYLKIEGETNKAQLFAVYDFGGGTLDYSFGMFRAIDIDDGEYAIDVYGVDGDENIGGENLISLISFWIYSSDENKKSMIENCIPFELPKNQKRPDDFPIKLINKSSIAKSNVRKLNETFSRALFENRVEISSESQTVDLYDENNDVVSIEISVDYELLRALLAEIIERTIENFYQAMQMNFETNKETIKKYGLEYSVDDVNIFKAGNSSRSFIVEEKMKERFPNNNIQLIDEIQDSNEYKQNAITPKTAIAFGQLRLNEFEVNILWGKDNAPFKWYVGNVNKGNGEFVTKIRKNELGKEWVQLGIIRGDSINVYYSGTPVINSEEDLFMETILVDEDDAGQAIYIRTFDETSIEYCVAEKGIKLDSTLDPNKNNVIKLN